MATLGQKINAERKARAMIKENGLPEPDRIEYGFTCIRVFWIEQNLCVRIDIDEAPPGYEPAPWEILGGADG
ncbi:MAG: hypothetical protein ACLP8S_25915 [Solirubrobacteraceae bacterium]